MSANVWFEQVDTALLQELKNTVKYRNQHGILVPLDDNALTVRKPEEEFKFESFPCVSIYNTNSKFDPIRYTPDPIQVGEDKEAKVVIMEDSAVPFNLTYQIDFWSRYQEDMNNMTMLWLAKHFRQFNLTVIDDGGTERSSNCLMIGAPIKSDLVLNGERLFHTIISYQIWVELDSETRYNISMVTERDFSIEDSTGKESEFTRR